MCLEYLQFHERRCTKVRDLLYLCLRLGQGIWQFLSTLISEGYVVFFSKQSLLCIYNIVAQIHQTC